MFNINILITIKNNFTLCRLSDSEENTYEVNYCCTSVRLFYIQDDPSIIENVRKKSESITETYDTETCQMKRRHNQVKCHSVIYYTSAYEWS